MSISRELVDVIKASNDKEKKGYDTQATVTRVEGSTVWVHIPGGVDETPVKRTVNAKEGDVVQVRVSGGTAWMMGNATAPPTDDTTALLATQYARTANAAAESAVQSAKTAGDAAADAVATAREVRGIAEEAKIDAKVAKDAADDATDSAHAALVQLGIAEDVVGTLNWISEHGKYELTSDSEIMAGKVYFIRTGSDPYIYTPVLEPRKVDLPTYYELVIDDAVSTYISMHLALTDEGLWVISDNDSYRVLISNEGMKIFDSEGIVVASFGESITFSSTRPQYIGCDDAFIMFYDSDADGIPDAINIGGSRVTILDNRSLEDIAKGCDAAEEDRDYIRQHFRMDDEGFTVAENLNGTDTGVRVVLKGDRMSFYHGASEVAYISDQRLYISQSVVLQQMDVGIKQTEKDIHGDPGRGQWSWKVHENANGKNNLYLKWLG